MRLWVSLVSLMSWAAGWPAAAVESGRAWTGFRGTGDGITQAKDLPVEWSHASNIAWVTDLPGYGQSTPVVWDDALFVTSTEGKAKETYIARRYRVRDGELVWERRFASHRPQEAGERTSRAAPTPAVDALAVYLLFDSGDLAALTHDGRQLWTRDLNRDFGPIQNGHDFGSSLRQSATDLFVHISHLGPSVIAALDKRDGSIRWRTPAPPEGGWQTPVLVKHQGRDVLLVSKEGGVGALDAATGRQLWQHSLGKASQARAVPSLAAAEGQVLVPSMNRSETYLLSLTDPAQPIWRAAAATTQYSTPLIYRGRVYLVNAVGVLFSVDLASGRGVWQTRLPGPAWASAIAAGDRIYFFTVNGETAVLDARPGDQPVILATNRLPVQGRVYAAAATDGSLFLREAARLWRLASVSNSVVVDPEPAPRGKTDDWISAIVPYQFPKRETPPRAGETRVHPLDGLSAVWIPEGVFAMGCSPGDSQCEDDERPVRQVRLSRGFWMHQKEVTAGAFKKFAAALDRPLPPAASVNPGWSRDELPMFNVTWQEASAYCAWIGGRLPSEAEWEYAARAGAAGAAYGPLREIAWYADNSGEKPLDSASMIVNERPRYMQILAANGNRPRPGGAKRPNAFGLYDMLGNVAEYTADWHGPYEGAPFIDPKGPAEGERRVNRGGGWSLYPSRIRVSSRGKSSLDSRTTFTGFRCVMD
jgi:outer membrane protein assembly factor BamB